MNFDKTFCGSPNCKNECGRKMTDKERQYIDNLPWKDPQKCPQWI